ncbi:MAG: CbtB domain-containing protein [Pseudomonadota bacterium]|nr:CbtB domain-containing protein [Pseudomonadota bacterium]
MQKENISTDLNVDVNSASTPKLAQLATAFLLGFVLLYGAGFVQTSVAHNASHDVRHAHAFPCH